MSFKIKNIQEKLYIEFWTVETLIWKMFQNNKQIT